MTQINCQVLVTGINTVIVKPCPQTLSPQTPKAQAPTQSNPVKNPN